MLLQYRMIDTFRTGDSAADPTSPPETSETQNGVLPNDGVQMERGIDFSPGA